MRAMAVARYGAPLQLMDLPRPAPGPGQVLLRVLGCGVCRSDLKIADGAMPFSKTLRLPHVPGHEIAAEIVDLGPAGGVAGAAAPPGGAAAPAPRIGDRVVVYNYWGCRTCAHCQAGEENLCERLRGWTGFTSPGGFQEYLVVPDDCVLPLPSNVPAEHGGPLSCALGTAYHAVVTQGAVRAGETVAILGAGGVGLHAVQVARAAGAEVLAVDLQRHRLDAARVAGAGGVFPAGDGAADAVREATAGRGADVVVDTVGHHGSVLASTDMVRRGGRIVLVGYTVAAPDYPPLPSERVVLGQLTVTGSRYVTRRELRRAFDLVARGLVRPVVADEVPLERANDALAMVREDRVTGRVVVRVAP
ncbi:MAG TPA: alcohol dehydrogenase catalytic domain-containing protein [bacterium]|nr:alcohol dehydrogenase catalytic domain-containing protein [bacterium]